MAVRRFEELLAWQRAMMLAEGVFSLIKSSPLGRDPVLSTQIWRSAVSVPSNIAEGFEKFSRVDFGRFLGIAKGSCGELRSQLELATRVGLVPRSHAAPLLLESEEVSKIIGALRASLNRPKPN